ncbi:hypothetical protein FGO68_gene12442 [Halteria grandinella]|uniref:RING-type domain-containing protein n=1 Tax=Halteria grandinella TaxID=5974 RepID=A0A8J8T3W2_HALGN|nr:hypothetical protein FGO68_gene12442 [Halteria grandinella]
MNPNEIYDFFTNLDLEANKKPVSQNLVESLPDTQVTNLAQTQRQGAASSDNKEENKCLVCMCEYEEGDMVKTLPCFHKYHKECIAEWFKRQNFCPFCRSEVK